MTHIKKFSLDEKDINLVSGAVNYLTTGGIKLGSVAEAVIRTQFVEVGRLRSWIGLNILGQTADLKFRLWDGARELFWNGTAWAVPTASDWNTATEIMLHFNTYPANKIAVKVKFTASASLLTDIVIGFRVSSSMEEDFLLSFISFLKGVTFEVDYLYTTKVSTLTIDLGAEALLKDYQISGVEAVYNHSTDPQHLTPLSFTYSAGKVTLASPLPAGKQAWILVKVSPVVAYSTSPDYTELEKYPAIVIESVEPVRSYLISQEDAILSATGFGATILGESLNEDYQLVLVPIAGKLVEHLRMTGSLRAFLRENPVLRLRDSGLEVSLLEAEGYSGRGATVADALLSGSIPVNVYGIEQGFKETQGYWIEEFNTTLNNGR